MLNWELDSLRRYFSRNNTNRFFLLVIKYIPKELLYGRSFQWYTKVTQFDHENINIYRAEAIKAITGLAEWEGANSLKKFAIQDRDSNLLRIRNLSITTKRKVRLVTTSGSSTGRPSIVAHDAGISSREWAYVHWAWEISGYKVGMNRASIRNYGSTRFSTWNPALGELRISCLEMDSEFGTRVLDEIKKYNCVAINAYPSVLRIIAEAAIKSDFGDSGIKYLLPISEPVSNSDLRIYSRAFPNATLSVLYGQTEKVALGRSRDGRIYEISPTYGLIEILDESGSPVAVGDEGRIISTGLYNRSVPLIRYDTGDRATLLSKDSDNFAKEISDIVPRRNNVILLGKSNQTSFSALNIHSENQLRILDFCVVQSKVGEIEIQVIPDPDDVSGADAFIKDLTSNLSEDFKIRVRKENYLPRVKGKKNLVVYQDLQTDIKNGKSI